MKQLHWIKSLSLMIIPLLFLSGCQSVPKLKSPDNVYEFNTRPTNEVGIPADVLRRAAFTAERRGYRYFTISDTSEGAQTSKMPTIGINYGRDPYGFSDPGADSTGGGISMDLPLNTRRIHWVVTMMHTPEAQSTKVYDVTEVISK